MRNANYTRIPNFRIVELTGKTFKIFGEVFFVLYNTVTVSVYSDVIVSVAYSNVIVSVCNNISNAMS